MRELSRSKKLTSHPQGGVLKATVGSALTR